MAGDIYSWKCWSGERGVGDTSHQKGEYNTSSIAQIWHFLGTNRVTLRPHAHNVCPAPLNAFALVGSFKKTCISCIFANAFRLV